MVIAAGDGRDEGAIERTLVNHRDSPPSQNKHSGASPVSQSSGTSCYQHI